MYVKRVDETSFQRRPFGVLENYLADKAEGPMRQRFVNSLSPDECLALVSKNGMNVIFVRGFNTVVQDGQEYKALAFYQIQLSRPWTLPMLQHFVKESRLPFTVVNYKSFEEVFPKVAKAAKVFVRKAA